MHNAPDEGEATPPAGQESGIEEMSIPDLPEGRSGATGTRRRKNGGKGGASRSHDRVIHGKVGQRVIEGFPLTRAEIELMVREVEAMQKERSLHQRLAGGSLTVFITVFTERMVNQFSAMADWQNTALNTALGLSAIASVVTGLLWMRAKPSKSIRQVIAEHIATAMKPSKK